jgi:hypothetical protein
MYSISEQLGCCGFQGVSMLVYNLRAFNRMVNQICPSAIGIP